MARVRGWLDELRGRVVSWRRRALAVLAGSAALLVAVRAVPTLWSVLVLFAIVVVLWAAFLAFSRGDVGGSEHRYDAELQRLSQAVAPITGVPAVTPVEVLDGHGGVRLDRRLLRPGEWLRIGRDEHGHAISVDIHYPPSFRDGEPRPRDELLTAIEAKLGGHWRGEWDTIVDRVRFHRVPRLPPRATYTGWDLGSDRLPLGLTDPQAPGVHDGEGRRLAVWDVRQAAHLLVTGRTGSGKTTLVRVVVAGALRAGWRVAVVDAKGGGDFGYLAGRPGVDVADDTAGARTALVAWARREMDERYRRLRVARRRGQAVADEDRRPVLLVVDEATSLLDEARRDASGPSLPGNLRSIARKGRQVGVHLLLADQRPDALEGLPADVRRNLEARLAVGPHDQAASHALFHDEALGPSIAGVKGRALLKTGPTVQRVQGFWLADPDDLDGASDADRRAAERWLPPRERRPADAGDGEPDDTIDLGARTDTTA
ncbi:MAG: DUF87 domain-containing protein [Actinobacteria bacterium]|nr:DUF87 domain-containing protein [Actinomycetota bacterium]